ncbi:LysE family translocator [Leeia oryzae]|uniref:LysE family translocator n=1 Tax=Leeia oryzae TaxID=356662 RepID=UPI000372965A|nr:LysE family translocator [Leeia oryzae]
MNSTFIITALIIVATPGTGAIYTLAAGLAGGYRSSLIAALGCTLGALPHLIAAISGIATIFHTSNVAFQLLKWLGVLYLLYMAVMMLKDKSGITIHGQPAKQDARKMIVDAVLINLLNPKLSLFFFAFLPQFIDPQSSSALKDMLLLSSIFLLLTFIVFSLYGILSAALRKHLISNMTLQKYMRMGFGVSFAGLALKLAFVSAHK